MDEAEYKKKYHDGLWATVYTDASASNQTGVKTWAAWAKSAEGRITKTGVIPLETWNINALELYAIWMGISLAYEAWKEKDLQGILVVSDNKAAVQSVWPWNDVRSDCRETREKIDALREKGLQIRTKEVRAHQGGHTTQSWLNEWCDQACGNKRRKVERRRANRRKHA